MAFTTASGPALAGEGRGCSSLAGRLLRAGWRTLDGALLLALGWLARGWPRGRATGRRGVVLVTNTMAIGGAQRQILLWLRQRAAAYAPVRLVVLTGGGAWEGEAAALGAEVEVAEANLGRTAAGRFLLQAMPRCAYVFGLWRGLRRMRPQAVWSWLFLANVVAAPAARLAGVARLVISERALSEWKRRDRGGLWWYRGAERAAAALSDAIVVNSGALSADYAHWLGCSSERIQVVFNGVDPAQWSPARASAVRAPRPDGPVVLSVGRLSPEKGHATLLKVSQRLRQEAVPHRLVLVGGGELEDSLKALARELGIADRVVFAGELADPLEQYRAADVFVLPSATESMPNALMEAQLCGLPAVTADVGGAGEVVVDGETGFVVPVGDEAAFASALKKLLEDPDLRRRMAEGGRRRMLEVFSVERMVGAMDEVFAELGVTSK